ncbi:hypothetical protein [Streptomyces sp. NPDC019937]|uniref:hypothetical protein n=1 Tax=Streptomyces sp. NPDC019937 TaxID=3154787 RepID=UPI0033F9B77F
MRSPPALDAVAAEFGHPLVDPATAVGGGTGNGSNQGFQWGGCWNTSWNESCWPSAAVPADAWRRPIPASASVVPRRAIDPGQLLDVCDLQDAWSRRRHLLAWGAKSRAAPTAIAALAEHLRRAALSEPASRGGHPAPGP